MTYSRQIYLDNVYTDPCAFNDAGFTSNEDEIMKACCGSGGPYNVALDYNKACGTTGSTVCSDPSKQINWDGAHLTEAAYRQIAKGLVEGPFSNPSLETPPFKIA